MSEIKGIEMDESFCIPTCTPTFEKDIYLSFRINSYHGGRDYE